MNCTLGENVCTSIKYIPRPTGAGQLYTIGENVCTASKHMSYVNSYRLRLHTYTLGVGVHPLRTRAMSTVDFL